MTKEVISNKQAIVLLSGFIIGSTSILGVGTNTKQDVWITLLLAMALAAVIYFVYARIIALYPGMNIYEILDVLFGKVLGKIISLCFIGYAFYLQSLILRNFAEFIRAISLSETPMCVIAFCGMLLSFYAIREGLEVFARWAAMFFPIMVFFVLLTTSLTLPWSDLNNFKPILFNGFKPVFEGALSAFAFPFAEAVLFIPTMGSLQQKGNPYKVYYTSLLIGGTLVMLVSLRSLLVLGPEIASLQYYSSYAAVQIINLGNFLQRIEVSVSIVFLISGLMKSSMCLYASVKGISHLLSYKMDYKTLALPVNLLCGLLALFVYKNAMQMFEWAEVYYKYFAFPFQVALPIITLIVAEFKVRARTQNGNQASSEE
jgi:spore germination protein KB